MGDPPLPRSELTHTLQLNFLNTAAEAEPKLLSELLAIARRARVAQHGEQLIVAMTGDILGCEKLPDRETLEKLKLWTAKWHIETPWARRLAWLGVLHFIDSGVLSDFRGEMPRGPRTVSELVVIAFGAAPYDPTAETYVQAQGRFEKEASRTIARYLRSVQGNPRMTPPPVAPRLTRQLWWTALWQCAGKSYNEIAGDTKFPADVRTIREGVRRMAARIGLPHRPRNRPGPRKRSVQKN